MQTEYLWLIVFTPFFGFLINLLLGRFLSRSLVGILACTAVFIPFVLSGAAFLRLNQSDLPLTQLCYEWIAVSEEFSIPFGLLVDQLSCLMILVITGVGFLIHVYSTGYMARDPRYHRYFSFLNLFTGFMLLLVMANNLLLMFVGWEGVGLCSYLLIGFWFEKRENAVAGMKAFIVNRIGDFGFTVGLILLFVYLGAQFGVWTLEVQEIKDAIALYPADIGILTLVGILLFMGACGKSAQIPLYVWLPDAMAGPTPVSALIHAATMVTAGVYMVARMWFLYLAAPVALTIVAVVGALTALFAATIGIAQNDIKRVLAYSTVSQIGYMFLGVGVGAFATGIFHLMTHAFFKACLFLGSGSVIHGSGQQDIRNMGGLRKYMPVTFWTFLIATLTIAGIPPLAGFFSKDEILWKAFSTEHLAVEGLGKVLWLLGLVAAGFTGFYMSRLLFKTFFGYPRFKLQGSSHNPHPGVHESPPSMTIPLVILAALSIIGGFVGIPYALGGGAWFEHWMQPVFAHGDTPGHHADPAEYVLMVVSVLVALGGIVIAWIMYIKLPDLPAKIATAHHRLYQLILDKYRIDELYHAAIVQPVLGLNDGIGMFDNFVVDGAVNASGSSTATGSQVTGYFDNQGVDAGVNMVGAGVRGAGHNIRQIQTGRIKSYLTTSLAGLLAVIFLFVLWLGIAHWIRHGL